VAGDHTISAGNGYACARTQDARVACWGRTPDGGHLGAVVVAGLDGVVGVATGASVYAWTGGGGVWQWDGTRTRRVAKLDNVVEIVADTDAACARFVGGRVSCWTDGKPPAAAPRIFDAVQVAIAGHEACARVATGDVVCWSVDKPAEPKPIPRARGAVALDGQSRGQGSLGEVFAAVLAGGVTVMWEQPSGAPISVPALPADVVTVSVGFYETCALGATVTCWSDDAEPDVRTVDALAGARSISLGDWVGCACAWTSAGVACQEAYYGRGEQSAMATTLDSELGDVIDMRLPINQGSEDLCLLRKTGRVECRVVNETALREVDDLEHVVALATGPGSETCGLRANGTVACWHLANSTGEPTAPVARPIAKLTDAVELVGGERHACVRRKRGQVSCWGSAELLGDGRRRTRDTPVVVGGVAL
jgi:hypothetical protein